MRWRPKDNSKWHKWFAWHHVDCRCGSTVWMETVWRRLMYPTYKSLSQYEYAVFEERPDICEDGQIPENAP